MEHILFNGIAPGSEGVDISEKNFEEINPDKSIKELAQFVTTPTITSFIPKEPNGTAILVIPGGGFKRQVMNIEGTEIANWLNTLGITAFVLKHRMPCDGHKNKNLVPLQDGQRAIRLIRHLSKQYGYLENRVGVMGFSAGGHLAASLGTVWDKEVYKPKDEIDLLSTRPDFLALIYPVISFESYHKVMDNLPGHAELNKDLLVELNTDKLINPETPETFITVADDDKTTPSENSINFYLGLRKNDIPAEMHVFKSGSHGFGLGKTRGPISKWTDFFDIWLKSVNFNRS